MEWKTGGRKVAGGYDGICEVDVQVQPLGNNRIQPDGLTCQDTWEALGPHVDPPWASLERTGSVRRVAIKRFAGSKRRMKRGGRGWGPGLVCPAAGGL